MKTRLFVVFLIVTSFLLNAQDDPIDDELITVIEENAEIVKDEPFIITGSFSGNVAANFVYNDIWTDKFDALKASKYEGIPSLNFTLGFKANPSEDFSVTGEMSTSYPFKQSAEIKLADGTNAPLSMVDIKINKLFSSFNYNNLLFFKFGKQSIRWGTGLFMSPADDIFSSTEIDVKNYSKEREGPLSLKIDFPIPSTDHYLTGILSYAESAKLPEDVALALKADFLFGNVETSIAGYYQREQAPKGLLMVTTGYKDFQFFGEGVLSFGSKKTFLATRDPAFGPYKYITEKRENDIFFSGTIGTMYSNSNLNLNIIAQYMFNGDGYDSSLTYKDAITYYGLASSLMFPFPNETKIGLQDIIKQFGFSQHYGSMLISFSDIFKTKIGFSTMVLANLVDLSGYINPTISYKLFGYCTLSVETTFSFGSETGEFTNQQSLFLGNEVKPFAALKVSLTLGSGSF